MHHDSFICINENVLATSLSSLLESRKAVKMCIHTCRDCFLMTSGCERYFKPKIFPQGIAGYTSPVNKFPSSAAHKAYSTSIKFCAGVNFTRTEQRNTANPRKTLADPAALVGAVSETSQKDQHASQMAQFLVVHTSRGDYVMHTWIFPAGGILNT